MGKKCIAKKRKYIMGGTAIEIVDANKNNKVTVATTFVQGVSQYLPDNQVCLETVNESNRGILADLKKAGIIKNIVTYCGHYFAAEIPICQIDLSKLAL